MSNLVTFKQKQRLEKIGYDTTKLTITTINGLFTHVERPIPVSEALDFIREKGVMLAVELESKRSRLGEIIGYEYGGAYINDKGKDIWLPTHPTHPLAESALLDAVLDYLESSKEKSFSES